MEHRGGHDGMERRTQRARVLVVDDEPLVGLVIQRAFEDEYDVVLVSSAQSALDLLDRGERFDVLLSDLMMPDMSGMTLHRALVERYPALARRTVFLTGGAYTPESRDFLDATSVEFLEKPFELDTLRALLRRLLAAEDGGA
jgi:CheY-like chemotaxis protein